MEVSALRNTIPLHKREPQNKMQKIAIKPSFYLVSHVSTMLKRSQKTLGLGFLNRVA
ncbi:hypothetical protein FC98_GL000763 [Lentilactobacillus kisonensis DSM 19906 = JCM 15041]|uniref:Uncharacterized protein n=2 Tax=Lentilactobacillus kisonensis TaxID=481722 RepID=H1LIU7_9LACO|nr:hypothetical protein HMPREF9104_02539 [Lentilactobacillus kisonensis F0435]KRL21429.1 hypothetical protein FC98_GL000763 [Lentilactobacillus kisonensis DSM 19906 = JCM 15041]